MRKFPGEKVNDESASRNVHGPLNDASVREKKEASPSPLDLQSYAGPCLSNTFGPTKHGELIARCVRFGARSRKARVRLATGSHAFFSCSQAPGMVVHSRVSRGGRNGITCQANERWEEGECDEVGT